MPKVLGALLMGVLLTAGCGDDDDGSGGGGASTAVDPDSGGGGGTPDGATAGEAGGGDGMAGTGGGAGASGVAGTGGMAGTEGGGTPGDGARESNEPAVVNVENDFTYDNELTAYTRSESYDWDITTGSALLRFQTINITGGSARLLVSNPSAAPLFDRTFSGSEQLPEQHLGPAYATVWRVDVEYENASGELVFSLEAVPPAD
jgi:hypothetical protein